MANHRYWRLYIFEQNGIDGSSWHSSVAELEMFTTPGGPNQCVGGVASASSVQTTWIAANGFDGIKNTTSNGWASANYQHNYSWLMYDFGAGNEKDIKQYTITARAVPQAPKTFRLQSSPDSQIWTSYNLIVDETNWTALESRTFDCTMPEVEFSGASESNGASLHLQNTPTLTYKRTFLGDGSIAGTVRNQGTPVQDYIVQLFHNETNTFLDETVTNVDGTYQFNNLDQAQLFDVVSFDPDDVWEKRVSSRRLPVFIDPQIQVNFGSDANLRCGLIHPAAPPYNQNVALNKPVSANFTPNAGTLGLVTDGDVTTNYMGGNGEGYVVVDLVDLYRLNAVNVRHYYQDGRTYYGTKTEISADGVNWVTIFDSSVDGTYSETPGGRVHTFAEQDVLYIRDHLNGSTTNTGSHWVEIEAYRTE